MPTPSLTRARMLLLALGLATAGGALAGDRLGTQAPAGVDPFGRWELDAGRSDDPAAVRAAWQRSLPKPKPRDHPPRNEPGDPPLRDAKPPAQPGGTVDATPANGAERERDSAPEPERRGGPSASPLGGLLDAITSPAMLELHVNGADIEIPRADGGVACTPGDVVAVMDRHGDSERRCGWQRGALVVVQEVKRGPRREDRYELTKDGSLAWSTTLTAKKSPPLVVRRVYRHAGPATGASTAAAPRGVPAN